MNYIRLKNGDIISDAQRFVLIDYWTKDRNRKIFHSIKDVPAEVKLKQKAVDAILKDGGSMIVNGRFFLMNYWEYKKLKRFRIPILISITFRAAGNIKHDLISLLKGCPKDMTLSYGQFYYPEASIPHLKKIISECKKKHSTFSNPVW